MSLDASPVKPGPKKKRSSSRPEFLHTEPFKPDYIYQMLQKIKSNLSYKVGVVSAMTLDLSYKVGVAQL